MNAFRRPLSLRWCQPCHQPPCICLDCIGHTLGRAWLRLDRGQTEIAKEMLLLLANDLIAEECKDRRPILTQVNGRDKCARCERLVAYFGDGSSGAYRVCVYCARLIWREARSEGRDLEWHGSNPESPPAWPLEHER